MIKGIIFDFGGTIDTGGDHWSHVIRRGWDKAGVVANEALFREAYVFGEQELERSEHILPNHTLKDLLKIKIELELQFLASNGHFPPAQVEEKATTIADYCYDVAKQNVGNTKEVLQKLSVSYPMVLISNYYGNLKTVLDDLGILNYFKKVIDSTDVGIRKPDTEIFSIGLRALKLPAEEVLVVGDSVRNDIEPARKLGCHTLRLEGESWEESPLADDGASIRTLNQILSFLAGE